MMTELTCLPIPLLTWYHDNARILPWRSDPTPYHVLVSEIMLQQTRVTAVLGYYERFLTALPTIEDLAMCQEDALMKLWQGLGYYSRARNLQKAARKIVEEYHGVFPTNYRDIRALPGVGDYTAGAIASLAFQLPEPAVDGNVLRVVSRLTGDRRDVTKTDTKAAVTSALREVIPLDAPGAFNQALMDLGATVCLPNGVPLCTQCPLHEFCRGFLTSTAAELPVKSPKRPRKVEERIVYLIFYRGQIALRRRASKGLLAGLWEYPSESAPWSCPVKGETAFAGTSKHIFTHIEWHLTAYTIQAASDTLPEGWVWASWEELSRTYAIPNAFSGFAHIVTKYVTSSASRQSLQQAGSDLTEKLLS